MLFSECATALHSMKRASALGHGFADRVLKPLDDPSAEVAQCLHRVCLQQFGFRNAWHQQLPFFGSRGGPEH